MPPATELVLHGINLHPVNVHQALDALDEVSRRFRALGDYRAIFPDVYGIITRVVSREILADTGFFQEPQFISRLAGRFAERYLETVAWSLEGQPSDCRGWGWAYRFGDVGATIPFQDAVLGISAHINFDLAQGLFHTIRELGREREPGMLARYKHDHDAVNGLLRASLPQSFEHLIDRYRCLFSRAVWRTLRRPAEEVCMAVLQLWREVVWSEVEALLAARTEVERARILVRMERRAAVWAGALCATSAAYAPVARARRWLQGSRLSFEVPRPLRAPALSLRVRPAA